MKIINFLKDIGVALLSAIAIMYFSFIYFIYELTTDKSVLKEKRFLFFMLFILFFNIICWYNLIKFIYGK